MTATPLSTPPPAPRPPAPPADAIWVGIPLRVRRLSAGLAAAPVDGPWVAVRPLVGLLAPPIALVAGLVIGAVRPGYEDVYTEALWLLILAAVLGGLSGALGLYFTVGFALGDLFLADHPDWRFVRLDDLETFAGRYGSLLISYALMALLAVGVPIAAKSLAADFAPPPTTPRALRLLVAVGAYVFVTGVLVFAWVQTAPLLVRPVFVWSGFGGAPTVPAIAPMQEDGSLIVLAGVLAAAVRVAAQAWLATQALTVARGGTAPAGARLVAIEERFRTSPPVVPALSRLPLFVRLAGRAALLTVLLSGLYSAYWQAGVTFLVLLGAQVLASPLVQIRMGAVGRVINRVPRLIRLLIVLVPVYLIATPVMQFFLDRNETSFIPFLLVTVVAAVLMTLLSPTVDGRPPDGRAADGRSAREEGSR
jgi:hypothetical protein